MSALFPKTPFIPAITGEVAEKSAWFQPAPAVRHGHSQSSCIPLPGGLPDYLQVIIGHTAEGTERTTALIYGRQAYLIHYELRRKLEPA